MSSRSESQTTSARVTQAVLRVLSAGMHSSVQDLGRPGLKKWGVPRGGVMDRSVFHAVNHILGNSRTAAVVEILLGNVRFECLCDTWVVLGGAGQGYVNGRAIRRMRTERLHKGDQLFIPHPQHGIWSYLAVEGGWSGDEWLDSRSVWPAAGMGRLLVSNDILDRDSDYSLDLPKSVAARYMTGFELEPRKTTDIRVWRGPQWMWFSESAQRDFFLNPWKISTRSNRAGYRLEGAAVAGPRQQMISEPIVIGSIQIPPDGKPIVLLNDGPTIGGYPKLALIDDADLDRFCQIAPGDHCIFLLQNA